MLWHFLFTFWAFTGLLCFALRWRHNRRDSVSNHQPHDCLLNRIVRRRSKNTSKLRVTAFVLGIHRWPVNSPHKGPVTRKMFPSYDVTWSRSNQSMPEVHVATCDHITRYWPALTNWGRYNMTAISQPTLSNAFSFMKIHKFRLKFH